MKQNMIAFGLLLALISAETQATSSVVELINLQTQESLPVQATSLPAPSILNRFLRCSPQRRYTLMDPRLVLAAIVAARQFKQRRVEILSAFRTARLNETLRAEGHQVALRSRHIHGQALDLRIPGVKTEALCAFFRQLRLGGVGCYEQLRFVHIDVGPVRSWSD